MNRISSNRETVMKQLNVVYRVTGLLACLVLLHGCAAATVIRKQPDFDNEQQQRLMHTFQPETVAPGNLCFIIKTSSLRA
jgi:hypothetical protein